MDMDLNLGTDTDMDRHTDTDTEGLDFIYLERGVIVSVLEVAA